MQWCNLEMIQWDKDAILKWFNETMIQWHNDAMTQWCNDTMMQWHNALTMQQYIGNVAFQGLQNPGPCFGGWRTTPSSERPTGPRWNRATSGASDSPASLSSGPDPSTTRRSTAASRTTRPSSPKSSSTPPLPWSSCVSCYFVPSNCNLK